ncbi:sucrase ferredoxin [Marinobacter sp. V034]|uniref:sucrase ferredoxin n=1 Tax=Marinobacter sp. V034 TaxID=3459610 RepID=UPI0040439BCB
MPNRVFCAVESEKVGDPLAGTGAHAQRNLLISWPSGKWLRSLRRAKDMAPDVIDGIEAVVESGRRVNLIHREQQSPEQHRVFLIPENLQLDLTRNELPAFLKALNTSASIEPWLPIPMSAPLVLCCTHGKKDKCCARFGYATFKSLEHAVNLNGYRFDVWQSSHLGGCRLATSAIVFPANRKYGRIAPDDILPFLEAESHDCPYLPCYRGNPELKPVEQCAEIAALQWLSARGYTAKIEIESTQADSSGDITNVVVLWGAGASSGRLMVRCGASEVMRYDTCADIQPEGPSLSTVWLGQEVLPISGVAV